MIYNFFKLVFRNIQRNKTYSVIILFGLSIGLAIFMLALLYADFHFSFDRDYPDAENIFTLTRTIPTANNSKVQSMRTPPQLLPLLKDNYAEIVDGTRYTPFGNSSIRYGENLFNENRICFGDPNFIKFFGVHVILGNPVTMLSKPNAIVLTEKMVQKYFGDTDPMGKIIIISNELEAVVTGVVEDNPKSSSVKYDFLISMSSVDWWDDWDVQCMTFIKLDDKSSRSDIEAHLPSFINKHLPIFSENDELLTLFPFVDVHLKGMDISDFFYATSPTQFYIVIATAVILLLVVCMNYMNLATARYMNRAVEVGIRKVVGASRPRLIRQFLSESVILSLLALPIAAVIFEIIRPVFTSITGNQIELSISQNPTLILVCLLITIFVGLISGCYPAFFLSSFLPAQTLKGSHLSSFHGSLFRKILVISQFSISVIMIIITLVVQKQFDYLLKSDLGYDRSGVIVIPISEPSDNIESLKNMMQQHPQIDYVSASSYLPMNWDRERNVMPDGIISANGIPMHIYPVGRDYLETINIQMLQGRRFSENFDDHGSFIINKTAVSHLNLDNPIGKYITVDDHKGQIIGIAEDFHFRHIFFPTPPSILWYKPEWQSYLFIRFNGNISPQFKQFLHSTWKKCIPESPLEIKTLESEFNMIFQRTMRGSAMFNYISIISIALAAMGLFGMASYTIERRTKEIGIRKVLGAAVPNLILSILSNFLRLVLYANIIALPVAYFMARSFLNWAWVYKTEISAFLFIISVVTSFAVAIISVLYQTLKAVFANPIKSLRYE